MVDEPGLGSAEAVAIEAENHGRGSIHEVCQRSAEQDVPASHLDRFLDSFADHAAYVAVTLLDEDAAELDIGHRRIEAIRPGGSGG